MAEGDQPEGQNDLGDMPEQFGRYRVLKQLGAGGMGAVYLAEDSQLQRRVALKTPFIDRRSDEKTIKRFLREARAAATIDHPNVCAVHDVGEIDGRYYLTMAYVEGRSLGDWMQQVEDIAVANTLDIVRKLASGLHAAHETGVIHRDLKPGNILMNANDEPFLIDFGMARRFDREETALTMTGTIAGTPAYMAPEQIAGEMKAVGPATDIYSLGVILYELLTGWMPFTGQLATVLGSIVTDDPPPLRSHAPQLPEALEPLCAKAMAKKPANRYASAADFADAISRYLDNDTPEQAEDDSPATGVGEKEKTSGSGGLFRQLWKSAFERKR